MFGICWCSVAGVIKAVADACVEGAVVLDLCEMGDQMILEETKKVFKKEKELKKGNHAFQINTVSTAYKHYVNGICQCTPAYCLISHKWCLTVCVCVSVCLSVCLSVLVCIHTH